MLVASDTDTDDDRQKPILFEADYTQDKSHCSMPNCRGKRILSFDGTPYHETHITKDPEYPGSLEDFLQFDDGASQSLKESITTFVTAVLTGALKEDEAWYNEEKQLIQNNFESNSDDASYRENLAALEADYINLEKKKTRITSYIRGKCRIVITVH